MKIWHPPTQPDMLAGHTASCVQVVLPSRLLLFTIITIISTDFACQTMPAQPPAVVSQLQQVGAEAVCQVRKGHLAGQCWESRTGSSGLQRGLLSLHPPHPPWRTDTHAACMCHMPMNPQLGSGC